ncbi:MAG: MoaD/ThiS family protein, partial [Longimicrobiales bacterium]|nr:MoaD/ThiS family protein [Longimicrobiales bacterium]
GSISVSADTVDDAFEKAVEQYPELAQHIYDDDGQLRNFVNAYLNEEDIRELDGGSTSVSDGDTIVIVPSIAGG